MTKKNSSKGAKNTMVEKVLRGRKLPKEYRFFLEADKPRRKAQ